ncbi:unnamed protein product [Cylindrotheca closterium]|uniref:Pseudouridine synthase RsuA/RluA-like domain-containing protein n=1 Tax=Cylindrotheca closterium TaxID=2856 RepID=A0AAD2CSL7_9STRA|nr:unnamed protein product [Cylindrotheca closterium]
MSLVRFWQSIIILFGLHKEVGAFVSNGAKLRQNLFLQNSFGVNKYHASLQATKSSDEISAFSIDLPDNIPDISILYESDRILIVDKPSGISHHNDEADAPGVVTVVRHQQQKRLWGVHRLDKVTSGILIFAKDAEMASHLATAFAEGKIQKIYVGVSAKLKPKKRQGWVKGGMSRSRNKSWKLIRDPKDKENFAKTRFFTAKLSPKYESDQVQDDDDSTRKFTCILFRPFTGRTHQLRVAAKSVGLALLGDPIYKDGQDDIVSERTYLHASGISIPSIAGEAEVNLWNPPPFESLAGKSELDSVLSVLMQKHCDLPNLLDAASPGLKKIS